MFNYTLKNYKVAYHFERDGKYIRKVEEICAYSAQDAADTIREECTDLSYPRIDRVWVENYRHEWEEREFD